MKSLVIYRGPKGDTGPTGPPDTTTAAALATHAGNANNPHGTTKAQVGLSNVDNTSDANKPVSAAQAAADAQVASSAAAALLAYQNSNDVAVGAKAPLHNAALTGAPTVPNVPISTNSNVIANTAFVQAVVADLVGGAPDLLNTLNELSAALADDPNFATTMATELAGKFDKTGGLISGNVTFGANFSIGGTATFTGVATFTDTINVITQATSNSSGKAASTKFVHDVLAELTPASVGLDRVDNTSDDDKPVSVAQADADAAVAADAAAAIGDLEHKVAGFLGIGDLNNLVASDITSKVWGWNDVSVEPKDFSPYFSEEGGIDLHGVDLSKSSPAYGVFSTTFVSEVTGTVEVEAYFKTAPGQADTEVGMIVTPRDALGTTMGGNLHYPLTGALTKRSFTFAATAGTVYLLQIYCSYAFQQAAVLVGGVAVRQSAYGNFMDDDFRRVAIMPSMLRGSRPAALTFEGLKHTSGSWIEFETDAEEIAVDAIPSICVSGFEYFAKLPVWVNGAPHGVIEYTRDTLQRSSISLPSGLKSVRIYSGSQSRPVSDVLGMYLRGIYLPASASFKLSAPALKARRVVVLGDSIATGANTSPYTISAFGMIQSQGLADVQNESYGYRTLFGLNEEQFCRDAAAINPTDFYIEVGTNDYGLNAQSAANFGTQYGNLLDLIHQWFPFARIYTQTMLVRSVETANTFGDTTAAYRTAIATAVSTRTWATLADGTAMLALADLDDGIHPHDIGHAKWKMGICRAMAL